VPAQREELIPSIGQPVVVCSNNEHQQGAMKMRNHKFTARMLCMAVLAAAIAVVFASSASARPGIWANFNNCPTANPETYKCIKSITKGGKVVLGKKTVPIVNPVTLQGGVTEPQERGEEYWSHLVAPINGVQTLSKTPQPVPGGLAGLINCKEIGSFLVRLSCEAVFENGVTGVNSTLELARPAKEVEISESNLAFEEGIALRMPVKVHLENPFLGSNCYVGSDSAPIIWNLTTGTTKPPAGTAPIKGKGGLLEFREEFQVAEITGTELVDNTWAAPGAKGCGGPIIEYLINPIINAQVGLPSAAGKNVAILQNTSFIALAEAVNEHP
jgi:hypothetical protein